MERVTKAAPNLELLRLVFEYPTSFGTWNPNRILTDQVFYSLGRNCKNLGTLAISTTSLMTVNGFQELLRSCPLKTLDFHKYDHPYWFYSRTNSNADSFGRLGDDLFSQLVPLLCHVESINLYEQINISEKTLIKLVSRSKSLRSLCINGIPITHALLSLILDSPLPIKSLSIINCKVSNEDLAWFCDQLDIYRRSIIIYSDCTDVKSILIDNRDNWFMNEKLDIFSLWNIAVEGSR